MQISAWQTCVFEVVSHVVSHNQVSSRKGVKNPSNLRLRGTLIAHMLCTTQIFSSPTHDSNFTTVNKGECGKNTSRWDGSITRRIELCKMYIHFDVHRTLCRQLPDCKIAAVLAKNYWLIEWISCNFSNSCSKMIAAVAAGNQLIATCRQVGDECAMTPRQTKYHGCDSWRSSDASARVLPGSIWYLICITYLIYTL